MSWFYLFNGTQQGPVDENDLAALVSSGAIVAESLVWKEGMADWLAASRVLPDIAPESGGGIARVGSALVTAGEKDLVVQQIREGVELDSELQYAGFWLRFVAKLIDFTLTMILFMVVVFLGMGVTMALIGGFSGDGDDPEAMAAIITGVLFAYMLSYLLLLVFHIAYNTWMVGRWGATLGKMALGLRVVDAEGGKVTTARAFGRAWADVLSVVTMWIGYIIAAFDLEKRSLHDHICSTRVVRK